MAAKVYHDQQIQLYRKLKNFIHLREKPQNDGSSGMSILSKAIPDRPFHNLLHGMSRTAPIPILNVQEDHSF